MTTSLGALLALAIIPAVAQAAQIAASVNDDSGRPVADAVVVAVPVDALRALPDRVPTRMVDQVDKEFVPKVLAVRVGTSVTFPNHDNVRHHVYSFSPAKRFELPLYAGVPAEPVVFDKPGVVVLGCNIHDWMLGYVYVSESPYFAKTKGDGKAVIELPPHAYVVRVWHPQLDGDEKATSRPIDVTRSGKVDAVWKVTLKPEVRVRRAPIPSPGRGY